MWRRLHILAGLLAVSAAGQAPVWQRLSHGGTEVLTAADPTAARAALEELEALRLALARAAPELVRTDARLRIVLFASGYEPGEFRLNAFSPAYYAPGPSWSTIVLFGLDERNRPALRHEFIHHLLRSAGLRLPLWLEEGLADALSPLPKSETDRRVKMLRGGRRIPWREVFQARPGAALYQDWDSARLFYAQSWALVEALIRAAGGAMRQPDLIDWSATDRLPEEQIEALLHGFLRKPRPVGRKWRLDPRPLEVEAGPAPAGLVWTVLGRLSMQLGDLDGAEVRLRQAALLWPESLPWLGELEYRRGRLLAARTAWRQAMAYGLADARTLRQLAVLEQDLPGGDMTPALERLLEADPSQEDARLALVSQYIRQGRWAEAWRRLHEVRSAPSRWEGFYRQALALARARLEAAELLGTN